jgi:chemotaxis protein CheZ
MAQTKAKKRFVAEILRDQRKSEPAAPIPDDEAAQSRHAETMAAISELRTFISENLQPDAAPKPAQPAQPAHDSAGEKLVANAEEIRHELEALRDAITSTKREIAAVRHPQAPSDPLMVAADELDAVVAATEQATNTILQSAETVDEMAERIKQATQDAFIGRTVEEMRELIVKIFEACNFQDITGQRITKVVNTVKFIEERVNAMIAIWGAEAFKGISVPATVASADPDHALLSGPQLPNGGGVSQDDIDKLFG